jgi:hypothetical protein
MRRQASNLRPVRRQAHLCLRRQRGRENKDLQKAWLNRESNPSGFRTAAGRLAKEFAKIAVGMPDPNATQDRELIAQYVKSTADSAPVDKHVNLGGLSNEEFKKHMLDAYGITGV